MAKKKIEETTASDSFLDDLIGKEFLKSQGVGEENEPKYYLDTGNYALNYCIGKNLRRSVPGGRIFSTFGLSGVGKSLLLASLTKDPQVDGVIVIDTEGGGLTDSMFKWIGAPLEKIKRVSISTFTDYRFNKENQSYEDIAEKDLPAKLETDKYIYKKGLIHFLKDIIYKLEYTKNEKKYLILLDSIANIKSTRIMAGGEDMGKSQKDINTLFSTLDVAIEKTNVCFCFTNKVYTNFGNVYDPWIQAMGQAVIYNPSVSVKLSSISDTEDMTDAEIKDEKVRKKSALGMSMRPVRATVTKSRCGTESRCCTFLLDSTYGIVKTSGLFELLKDFGLAKKNGSYYSVKGIEQLENFYKKDFPKILLKDEEVIINKLQELLNKREEEIKEERAVIQVSDMHEYLEETGGVGDDTADGIDASYIAKVMESDLEQ